MPETATLGSLPSVFSPLAKALLDGFSEGVVVFDAEGKVLIRCQLKRRYVLPFFQKLQPCLAHSEVGKLRTVLVCRPSLAHQRLTPGNCHDLFDDAIWIHEAQKDHYDFTLKMKKRGVEVLELHDLLVRP